MTEGRQTGHEAQGTRDEGRGSDEGGAVVVLAAS